MRNNINPDEKGNKNELGTNKVSPKDKNRKSHTKRLLLEILLLIVVVFFNLICFSILDTEILPHDLQSRALNELESRTLGKVHIPQGVYTGKTDFGLFDGDGTFNFVTGTVYSGMWQAGNMSGQGQLRIPDKGVYSGEFKDSKKSGRGTFTWNDGCSYKGQWENDKMSGYGEYNGENGLVYSGEFKDNNFYSGKCTFENETGSYELLYKNGEISECTVSYSDGTSYKGGCSSDGLSGNGYMNFISGDCYTGEYSNSARNGNGKYVWSTGDCYEGFWKNDKMCGEGLYIFADGRTLNGIFSDNSFEDGIYTVKNEVGHYEVTLKSGNTVGLKMILPDGFTYVGDVSDSMFIGTAEITYRNGDTYSGEVIFGNRSGQGKYKWKNGASYSGTWSNNLMDGSGTYFYPPNGGGYKLEGTFDSGKPVGQCIYYKTSTDFFKTDWENGRCVKVYE